MAQVQLHGVLLPVQAIAQAQRVLVARARVTAHQAGVLQRVLAPLGQHRESAHAAAPFVVHQVIAQQGFGAVVRGRPGVVAVARLAHGHTRAPRGRPVALPVQAIGIQGADRTVVALGAAVVAGVRIAGQGRDVQALARAELQAHARIRRFAHVAVLVHVAAGAPGLGIEALAVGIGQAQGIVPGALPAAESGRALLGAVRARAHGHMGLEAGLATAGEDLHRARHGVRAIQRTGRAAQHLDALDRFQRQRLPGGAAGAILGIDADAVDIHRRVLFVSAPHEQICICTRATVAGDLDARHLGHDIFQRQGAAALQGLPVQHRHIRQHLAQALLGARGRDHHLIQGRRGRRRHQARQTDHRQRDRAPRHRRHPGTLTPLFEHIHWKHHQIPPVSASPPTMGKHACPGGRHTNVGRYPGWSLSPSPSHVLVQGTQWLC